MSAIVNNVFPNKISLGKSTDLVLTGVGFVLPLSIVINGIHLIPFFANNVLAKFILPYIPDGIYDITLINGDGSVWISRSSFRIIKPSTTVNVGSATTPLVLAPVLVESLSNTNVSSASANVRYNTPANITISSDNATATATKSINTSFGDLDATNNNVVQNDNNGTLDTPWGNFKN